jgi:HemK-like putative methylase
MQSREHPNSLKFMGVDIVAPDGVLRPRVETETLGRYAVERLGLLDMRNDIRVLDMCCGSGNLAVAIATQVPSCRVWAADLTDSAVDVTKLNIELNRLSDRVEVRQGDLFAALACDGLEGTIDIIVCNPPYISTARLESTSANLLLDEPREAFDGGPFGLSIHQRIVRDALAFLKPDGLLLCEFGEGQARQVATLVTRTKAYHPPEFVVNAEGIPSVAVARRLSAGLKPESPTS